jgi:uncharacterized protein YciI
VDFDRYTITLLIHRDDGPPLDAQAADNLQDAHMSHLADLHEQGYLLAAGPLLDDTFRGLSILNVDPDRARELKEADPAVSAGIYSIKTIPWIVPAGAMYFTPAHFPRAMADVGGT